MISHAENKCHRWHDMLNDIVKVWYVEAMKCYEKRFRLHIMPQVIIVSFLSLSRKLLPWILSTHARNSCSLMNRKSLVSRSGWKNAENQCRHVDCSIDVHFKKRLKGSKKWMKFQMMRFEKTRCLVIDKTDTKKSTREDLCRETKS